MGLDLPRHPNSSIALSTARSGLFTTAAIALLIVLTLSSTDSIAVTTYRCEVGIVISYSDKPCLNGKERSLSIDPANPTDADKAAAIERAKAEKHQLKQIEDAYEKERKQAEANQKKVRQEKSTRQKQCAKLEVKIRREREDLSTTFGKNATQQRTRLKRAEEDYAMDCKA